MKRGRSTPFAARSRGAHQDRRGERHVRARRPGEEASLRVGSADARAGASLLSLLPFRPWRLPGSSVKRRLSIVRDQVSREICIVCRRPCTCCNSASRNRYGGAGSDLTPACGHQRSPATAGLFLQRIEQMAVHNDLLIASAWHARTASPHAPKHDVLCRQRAAWKAPLRRLQRRWPTPHNFRACSRAKCRAGESKRGRG